MTRHYEVAKPRGQKRRHGQDMRKFKVTKDRRYYFSPVKHFKSKKQAKTYFEKEKEKRPGIRYRIIKNPKSTYNKIHRKYTGYQTIYP